MWCRKRVAHLNPKNDYLEENWIKKFHVRVKQVCNSSRWKAYTSPCLPVSSRVAQWKRAGPITQRSEDQNLALLVIVFYLKKSLKAFHYLSTFFPSINLKENHASGTKRRRMRLDGQLKESKWYPGFEKRLVKILVSENENNIYITFWYVIT